MGQRAVTELEIAHVLQHADTVQKSIDDTWEAIGHVNGKRLDIVFVRTEKYIRIVTLL